MPFCFQQLQCSDAVFPHGEVPVEAGPVTPWLNHHWTTFSSPASQRKEWEWNVPSSFCFAMPMLTLIFPVRLKQSWHSLVVLDCGLFVRTVSPSSRSATQCYTDHTAMTSDCVETNVQVIYKYKWNERPHLHHCNILVVFFLVDSVVLFFLWLFLNKCQEIMVDYTNSWNTSWN